MNLFSWPIVRNFTFKLGIALIVILCIQLLHKPFSEFIIKGVFGKMDFSNLSVKILFVITSIFLLVRSIYLNRGAKRLNYPIFSTLIIFILTIYLYRLKIVPSIDWDYISLGFGSFLYIDVVAIFLVIKMVADCVIVCENSKHKHDQVSSISKQDLSITNPNQDKYGFKSKVHALTIDIINNKYLYEESAYAVGIVGGWGSGKSSFVNLIKHNIEAREVTDLYEKAIVIEFNPWFCKDRNQIMTDFLLTIKNELSVYNPKLASEIDDYIWLLSNLKLGILSDLTKLISKGKSLSLQQKFNEVNSCIRELRKPLFIVIDDIDRLMGEEILAVLQLVRNTANFGNTVFFIPYDHDYLISTMQKVGIQMAESYLCKIINLPYNLPAVSFDKYIDSYSDIFYDTTLITKSENNTNLIKGALKEIGLSLTPRDVKRLAISVASSIHNLIEEKDGDVTVNVDLYDLIILEKIKINNPLLFNFLYLRKDVMFKTNDNYFVLDAERNEEVSFVRRFSTETVPETDAKRQFRWLSLLFDDNVRSLSLTAGHTRIRESAFFEFYFKRAVDINVLTLPVLQKAIDEMSKESLDSYIKSLLKIDEVLTKRLLEDARFKSEEKGIFILDSMLNFLDIKDLDNTPLIGRKALGGLYSEDLKIAHQDFYKEYLYEKIYKTDPSYMFEAYKKTIVLCLLYKKEVDLDFLNESMSDLFISYIDVYVKLATSWDEEIIPYLRKYIEIHHRNINNENRYIETILIEKASGDLKSFVEYLRKDIEKSHAYPLLSMFDYYDSSKSTQCKWDETYANFLLQQPESIKQEQWYIQHVEYWSQGSLNKSIN